MSDSPESPSGQSPPREDLWPEDATEALFNAWARRCLELNGGALRQRDWEDVANAVNAWDGYKTPRTVTQCSYRIDTLKKYKAETARILDSNGTLTSPWPLYQRLEFLSRSVHGKNPATPPPMAVDLPTVAIPPPPPASFSLPTPPMAVPLFPTIRIPSPADSLSQPPPPMAVPLFPTIRMPSPAASFSLPSPPVAEPLFPSPAPAASCSRMVVPLKRPSPYSGLEESHFRRNYSAAEEGGGGMKMLADAIQSFTQVYEKMETMKLKQMIELERQRMRFAEELTAQTNQLFADTLVRLEKTKRMKRYKSPADDRKGNGDDGGGGGGGES